MIGSQTCKPHSAQNATIQSFSNGYIPLMVFHVVYLCFYLHMLVGGGCNSGLPPGGKCVCCDSSIAALCVLWCSNLEKVFCEASLETGRRRIPKKEWPFLASLTLNLDQHTQCLLLSVLIVAEVLMAADVLGSHTISLKDKRCDDLPRSQEVRNAQNLKI